jgi:hypothetical protein
MIGLGPELDGWVGEWMDLKTDTRFAYNDQKSNLAHKKSYLVNLCNSFKNKLII